MPRGDECTGDEQVTERRGKGVRHTGKSPAHSYSHSKPRPSHSALTAVPRCLPGAELEAPPVLPFNFNAALLPSKVTHSPPRTHFLALNALNSSPHVPEDTRNCSGEQEMGRKSCRKKLSPQIRNSHLEGSVGLSVAEGGGWTLLGCL